MAQHRRSNSSDPTSAVYSHLKEKTHSFEDNNVKILDREDRWFERGVKEAIYVKIEKPSLNRRGGLRHHISSIYNVALSSVPRRFNKRTSDDSQQRLFTKISRSDVTLIGANDH